MSRETKSCKTNALTLSKVELHPVVDAPLGKKPQVQPAHLQSQYFEIISVQKNAK
jgi:hypothetical protein